MNLPLSFSLGTLRLAQAQPDATPTDRVAGYSLKSVLGRGRHAVVFLAREPVARRQIALKLARNGASLAHEFGLQARAAHPHVVTAYAHGRSHEGDFIAMAYASGGTLTRLCGRPMDPVRAYGLALQVAAALAAIHRQGVVHRDVKPANCFIRDDGSIAIGDFGCACLRSSPEWRAQGAVVGTPQYGAPEQSQGAAADPTADVYSLGVVIHELLTGLPPFLGGSLIEQISQHLIAVPPRLPQALGLWQPLLDTLLAKDPGGRPVSGEAALAALQRLGRTNHWPEDITCASGARTTP